MSSSFVILHVLQVCQISINPPNSSRILHVPLWCHGGKLSLNHYISCILFMSIISDTCIIKRENNLHNLFGTNHAKITSTKQYHNLSSNAFIHSNSANKTNDTNSHITIHIVTNNIHFSSISTSLIITIIHSTSSFIQAARSNPSEP